MQLWLFYGICSIIVLVATWSKTDVNESDEKELDQAFGEVLPMLSIVGTMVMVASYFNPCVGSVILGTRFEAIITIVCLAFAIILVAIITGPGHGLAVDDDGAIAYGNQYYFAWVALFTCFVITQNMVATMFGINVAESIKTRSKSFSYWMALLFSSVVVMGSSAEYHGRQCGGMDERPQPFCSRCVFGITVGVIGVFFSGGIVVMKIVHGLASPFLIEVGICLWLALLYLFEVGFVTDNKGPGAPLGNLYYFSWISFLLTIGILNACHEDYLEAQQPHQQVSQTEMPTLDQVPSDGDGVDADAGDVENTIVRDIEHDSEELASSEVQKKADP